MGKVIDAIKWFFRLRLIREIDEDRVFDVAASVAFWLVLSLPAALLTGLASVSLLGDDLADQLRRLVNEFVAEVFDSQSKPLQDTIDQLFKQPNTGVLSASIATALFTLSRGFAGLVRALDLVYDVDSTRNFFHARLLSIILGLGTILMVAGATAVWVATVQQGWPFWVRALLAVLTLVFWSATMFHIGPNISTPWRYDLPGALFASIGWLALSLGFGWYIELVAGGDANSALGLAGALLLGLTWVWAACVVFLVGGEINQMLAADAGVIRTNRTVVRRVIDARTGRIDGKITTRRHDKGRDEP